ncbi:hypothetical protein SAMN04488101_11415 [Pedobacter nyackensis]|uniref:Uncharacterized protein n=1 Tax=Pedobacter nyackensis TaxID=475255 RepID=A0A1W2ENE9_9SPHI|nr:hypothetical protein SAMN04488101_11415 [Pedobacter nyackensis]
MTWILSCSELVYSKNKYSKLIITDKVKVFTAQKVQCVLIFVV